MQHQVASTEEMKQFGQMIGRLAVGGQVLELVGDVGAGKTTLTKGIAAGLGVRDDVQSPTFTISRLYETERDLVLGHYDFYRLHDPGIMAMELAEALADPGCITVIEWGEIVSGVMPGDRLTIDITATAEDERRLTMTAHGERSRALVGQLEEAVR